MRHSLISKYRCLQDAYAFGSTSRHLLNSQLRKHPSLLSSFYESAFRSNSSSANENESASQRHLAISQGGRIILDFSEAAAAKINITSKWQDHCQISDESHHSLYQIAVGKSSNSCEICYKDGDELAYKGDSPEKVPFFDIIVPEIVNLTIVANDLDLNIKNKVMGDIDIMCSSGKINMDKIRGESLNFNCGQADIKVSKLLEGTSSIACRSFYGKMVNGENIKIISMQDVTIEAMYGDSSSINCMRNVHIDIAKGVTNINANGAITIKGIDGKFDARSQGKIDIQVNKLSPGSSSCAISSSSTVSAKIDPELTLQLDCKSDTTTARNSITIVSEGFLKHDNEIASEQITNPSSIQTISGIITSSKNNNNKRPDFAIRSKGSGKIDLDGAEAQSLNAVTKQLDNKSNNNNTNESKNNYPSLLLSSKGHIRVESLSWIEAIVRNHGLEDVYRDMSSQKMKVGRTASASSRAREILKEN